MRRFLDQFKDLIANAEFLWKLVTWAIILSGGTVGAVLTRGTELAKLIGPVAIYAVGLISVGLIALTVYLVKSAAKAAAEALLFAELAARPGDINPLLNHFSDLVIPISSLQLPGMQLHSNKQFIRCKFVGPGALCLLGGIFDRNSFNNAGHILTIPDNAVITGLTCLENCTVQECEFFQITLVVPRNAAARFAAIPNAIVAM